MKKRFVTIKNRNGLHAKPAAEIVKAANYYQSDIRLMKDTIEVNAKSIMDVLILAASYGTQIIIKVEGEDEDKAIEHIAELLIREE